MGYNVISVTYKYYVYLYIHIYKQLTLGESSRKLFRDTTLFKLSYFMVYKFLSYT